jgi:hypothetical protein
MIKINGARMLFVSAAATIALASSRGDAAFRYRVDGGLCERHLSGDISSTERKSGGGTQVFDNDDDGDGLNTASVYCPLLTGPTLVELHNTNGVQLEKVTVRLDQTDTLNEDVTLLLIASDYDSNDTCIMDTAVVAGSSSESNALATLDYSGCAAGMTEWTIGVFAELSDDTNSNQGRFEIKAIVAWDT